MKKTNVNTAIKLFLLISLSIVVGACAKDDKPDEGKTVITKTVDNSDFGKYLNKNFTEPYNISYLYRWEDIESDMNYALVPANYENSVKMANLVKYLCLDAYDAVAPNDFLKKYFPKMIMLVGSWAYRNNGTIVLGTAEGGLKITLYGMNELDTDFSDSNTLPKLYNYYFRTIFHEFSHILHQTTDYSNDFRTITGSDYIGDSWSNTENTLEDALKKGFISRYSRKETNEDFVELIAYYITYTDTEWNDALTKAGTEGAALINQKMEIVKSYMLQTWRVDLDALKKEINTRASNIQNVDLTKIN